MRIIPGPAVHCGALQCVASQCVVVTLPVERRGEDSCAVHTIQSCVRQTSVVPSIMSQSRVIHTSHRKVRRSMVRFYTLRDALPMRSHVARYYALLGFHIASFVAQQKAFQGKALRCEALLSTAERCATLLTHCSSRRAAVSTLVHRLSVLRCASHSKPNSSRMGYRSVGHRNARQTHSRFRAVAVCWAMRRPALHAAVGLGVANTRVIKVARSLHIIVVQC
jgi:hypothetical protein